MSPEDIVNNASNGRMNRNSTASISGADAPRTTASVSFREFSEGA